MIVIFGGSMIFFDTTDFLDDILITPDPDKPKGGDWKQKPWLFQ